MRLSYRHVLMLGVLLATGLVSACLPDAKDPDKTTSDAGQITGDYYAAALGNIALKIQNGVVSNASWFTTQTNSMQLNLASMGIDANMLAAPVKSSICPTGSGSEVLQMTWIDGRDATGKFTIKGMGSDAGRLIGELRTRVATDQVGQYTGGTSLAMESGSTLTMPASCANMSMPVGAPVLVFRISRPAAPVSEMSRTEYRTAPCADDIRGRAMRGTMVQSRVVKYLADGSITPSSPNAGWNSDDIGQCVTDTDVVGTKNATNTTGASAALGNFADIVAQGMKSMLESQLQMGCTNGTVSKDAVVDGRRDQSSKTIDTCKSVNITATGTSIDETGISNNADRRNVCPRYADVTRSILGVSTGRYISDYGSSAPTNVAYIERVVDKVDLSTDTTNQGQREVWVGKAINCAGTDDYIVNCSNVPKRPTGPEDSTISKFLNHNIDYYKHLSDNPNALAAVVGAALAVYTAYLMASMVFAFLAPLALLALLFGSTTTMIGNGSYVINWDYFHSIHTYHGSSSTTTAHRGLHATSWTDPYQYFIPNFNVPPATLGWHVPAGTNQCRIMKREIQLDCPLNYDASKQANWYPYELPANSPFMTTMIPGGSYGGDVGKFYDIIKVAGDTPALAWLDWKKCNIKGCDYWTDYAGPGTDSYIKSWTYGDSSSVGGPGSTVQTIMMNKDGQKQDYTPTIVSGPLLEYVGKYVVPLHCGRIESGTRSWPSVVYYQDCGGKGGCKTRSYNSSVGITETTTREWSGDNATDGTWSRPVTVWTSPYGTWGSLNDIPNPIVYWQ